MEAQTLLQAMTWAQNIKDKNRVLDRVREAKVSRAHLDENTARSLFQTRPSANGSNLNGVEVGGRVDPRDGSSWER